MARRPARIAAPARAWLLAELKHLAQRSPDPATGLADAIRTARVNLGDYPEIGSIGLIPGTRRLVVGAYVLTTRRRGGITEVAAIRHAGQGDAYAPAEAKPD